MSLNQPTEHQSKKLPDILSDTRLNPNSFPQGRPAPPISSRAIFIVGGCLLFIILAWVASPIISAGFNRAYCVVNDCDPSGPAVPWATQLAVADEAALKVDKDALLDDVTAWPAARDYSTWTYTKTLEVVFYYYRPSGERLDISFYDTNPTSTLRVSSYDLGGFSKDFYDRLPPRLQKDREALQANTLGPRDVISQTWSEASAHAKALGIRVYPLVGLGPGGFTTWDIAYWPSSGLGTRTPKVTEQFTLYYSSSFDVDGKTGTIKDRKRQFLQPTVTPTK